MPEGDTLHRIAAKVHPAVSGREVARLTLADRGEIPEAEGWRVEGARAVGKHLLVAFETGWTLRTHLGMNGRVFVAGPGMNVPARTTFTLRVGPPSTTTVVCVRAYRAELLRTTHLPAHARLSRLGPDLLADPPDLEEAVQRATRPAHARREIADVLLDQRIAAGIGNVYKSEVLFLEGVHPRTRLDALDGVRVRSMYERAADLLRFNLRTPRRTTVPTRRRPYPDSPRLWVYGRTGEPCLECRTPIVRFVQGDMARATWYCPECQGLEPGGDNL